MSKIDFIHNGGLSKRFHTVDTIKTQDIAAHSFGVAWLCEFLSDGKASKNLIMAALAHDLAEHIVGDIPSPSKREMGIVDSLHSYEMTYLRANSLSKYEEELTQGEAVILKLADNIDGMLFCVRERRLGNKSISVVYGRFLKYALEAVGERRVEEANLIYGLTKETVYEILEEVNVEWNIAHG